MYAEQFSANETQRKTDTIAQYSAADVERCLSKNHIQPSDLECLISPAAEAYLEPMAARAQALTRQRFGQTMQLFIPLYLSNECFNSCTYCGFSMEHEYPRVTLSKEEILTEGRILKEKGFQHILLLTGEAPGRVGTDYIAQAVEWLSPLFPSIGIEVQPLSKEDYDQVIRAGADSLTLYQESYHPETYDAVHKRGKKKNFTFRLNSPDAGGKAQFYRMTIGALMGLYDWRYEAVALRDHLTYLAKHYWQTKLGISFPRIKDMVGEFSVDYPVSDRHLTQLILAFRLCFPDVTINLSTREPAELRNHLIHLGVTTMSAESHTEPGGYSGKEAEKQFEISDERSLDEIKTLLTQANLEPVMKDWDRVS